MTSLPPGTIQNLQSYISAKIDERGFDDEPVQERLLLLTEEVGELVKACRKMSGMYVEENKVSNENIGAEIADVINMVFAVGIELGLDIEKEFREKEAKNDLRVYKRSPAKGE